MPAVEFRMAISPFSNDYISFIGGLFISTIRFRGYATELSCFLLFYKNLEEKDGQRSARQSVSA